jgi:hypothetical protein
MQRHRELPFASQYALTAMYQTLPTLAMVTLYELCYLYGHRTI